ncbi:MAG: hypothetical protein NVSMB64_19530 [Candidatus Velthaea sp.]
MATHANCEPERTQDVAFFYSRRATEDDVAMRVDESAVEMFEEFCLWQVRLQREIKRDEDVNLAAPATCRNRPPADRMGAEPRSPAASINAARSIGCTKYTLRLRQRTFARPAQSHRLHFAYTWLLALMQRGKTTRFPLENSQGRR